MTYNESSQLSLAQENPGTKVVQNTVPVLFPHQLQGKMLPCWPVCLVAGQKAKLT
jgi:hypothetical protein